MIDISVHDLKKAFSEGENILDGLRFDINDGERVGLLGNNGAGKTTLFRILAGELREDAGEVMIAPGKRLGLISQIPRYPEGFTAEDVLKTAQERVAALGGRMAALAERMERDSAPALLAEYDRVFARFEALGGYHTDLERNRVANGLGIPVSMREQLFESLSGGEKTRVNLARLILEDTDILLLDEPTNHLDMHATEWLEEYLKHFAGTVLVISHDRWFLDAVVSRTIEIEEGKAVFYGGAYSFYVGEKRRRLEEQQKKYEKEQKELRRLDESARRLYQWGTGNERLMKKSKAIRSRMERMEKTERPVAARTMKTRFGQREFNGDEVLVAEGLGKNYDGRTLFAGVDLLLEGGERIALIGDNGTGKSTLLKLILGEEEPSEGRLHLGPSVRTACLPQHVRFEDENRSVLDTVMAEARLAPQEARNRLGAFGFSGEDVNKRTGALSGGEQSRLRLCILMRDEINLLILDEPTNHLDLQSREWIEAAVGSYGEALLFVSHDRWFIEKFAERIWELKDGRIEDFRGGFSEFLETKALREAQVRAANRESDKKEPKKPAAPSAAKQLAKAEREVAKAEAALSELDVLIEAHASDYEKLMELEERRAAAEAALDTAYADWEALSG
jgi:ATPase subunit of ABC transporter with duplicated ATPase domains